MLTIPTLQAAVALIVHLPAGCTVSSESQPGLTVGRLVLSQKKVEEIFRRKVTKFSQLTTGKNNVFAGAKCKKATEITRVVRLEGAGTTAQLKKWLELVNGKAEAVVNGKTWLESGEEPPANTEWPEETTKLIRGKGNSGVVAEVEKTAGSIGYVDLTNARKGPKLVPPEGGEGKEEFWAEARKQGDDGHRRNNLQTLRRPGDERGRGGKSQLQLRRNRLRLDRPRNGQSGGRKVPAAVDRRRLEPGVG